MRGAPFLLAVAVAIMLPVGCGDGDADTEDATTGAAQTTAPDSTKVDLTTFLMRPGEEPGFKPVETPQVQKGVDALLMPGVDPERAERSGFISTAYQPIEAEDRKAAGVTVVNLFESEAQARDWSTYESSREGIKAFAESKVRPFTVPDVPGARGRSGLDSHGNRVGYVFWVQGRCSFVLANETDGALAEPLSAGAKAIHTRTGGDCPG
jgi:hypothetical protein